jgi:hypothetical protein
MYIPIVILALMLYTVPSEAAQKDVVVKGKPVKTVVMKDRAGRKKICQIVIDKKTKQKVTVCK